MVPLNPLPDPGVEGLQLSESRSPSGSIPRREGLTDAPPESATVHRESPKMTDLVRRALDGDLDAFEHLYRENLNRVYALALRMTADATQAEDLTQEIFVRAWQKLSTFRGDSSFSTWLHRLAVNLVIQDRRSHVRRLARITPLADMEGFDRGVPDVPTGPRIDLERAIATLPPGARTVFLLHDVEGYKHEEIARRTGSAVGTVKAQLFRARRLLRKVLDR
jgi:RNA polymerase sigma-70 factor (ECF subfamily)